MKRYGWVIGLNEAKRDEYVKLHADVWPGVLKKITECNFRNYSIFLGRIEGKHFLFSYFEHTGSDFDADMASMAADPLTQEWWSVCKPCQQPLTDRAEGEWWACMEEVFHLE